MYRYEVQQVTSRCRSKCLSCKYQVVNLLPRQYILTYLLTYLLTYSMEQSPSWEGNQLAASQAISCILWNPKVNHHIYNSLPPVPILSQLDPVRTPTSDFLKIHLNVILLSMPGSPKQFLSFRFPHQNSVYTSPLPHTCYMFCPSHSSRFHHPKNIGWAVQILSSSFYCFLHSPVTLSLLGPNIFCSTLFSNTLSLCFFLNVSDQVSHPSKQQAFLYILIITKTM